MNSVNVYVGAFGNYEIPSEIYAKAMVINNGKKFSDRRTRGRKFLDKWGEERDLVEMKKLDIYKQFHESIS